MIEAQGLSKVFERINDKKKKESFYAVNDVSFKVSDGEILGILGPNGA